MHVSKTGWDTLLPLRFRITEWCSPPPHWLSWKPGILPIFHIPHHPMHLVLLMYALKIILACLLHLNTPHDFSPELFTFPLMHISLASLTNIH